MSTMPKPLKTERTHEENQERCASTFAWTSSTCTDCSKEHTLPPLDEATEAWRPASSRRDEPLRFTRSGPAALSAYRNKMY